VEVELSYLDDDIETGLEGLTIFEPEMVFETQPFLNVRFEGVAFEIVGFLSEDEDYILAGEALRRALPHGPMTKRQTEIFKRNLKDLPDGYHEYNITPGITELEEDIGRLSITILWSWSVEDGRGFWLDLGSFDDVEDNWEADSRR
jgi:hypothetical protein